MSERDWFEWHAEYDRPGSPLGTRLGLVKGRIRDGLDAAPPGPVQVISVCAGQGRDLLEVLASHPRRGDVRARLVELDARNTAVAHRAKAAHGLTHVDIVTGDASNSTAYEGAVPAHLVLFCGIWGNVTDDDVRRSIELLPMLC